MLNSSLVSVIVPVYNVEKYISQCINSILKQTYSNIEVILVDDGSTDDSSSICDEYMKDNPKIRAYHKNNGGLSDARNYGIDRASGEYILFVDSDDLIRPNLISLAMNAIKKNSLDIVFFSYYKFDCNDKIKYEPSKYPDISVGNSTEFLSLLFGKVIENFAWSIIAKKELYQNLRFPKGRTYEDKALTYRLIGAARRLGSLPAPLYGYRIRENSITSRMKLENIIDDIKTYDEQRKWVHEYYPFMSDKQNLFYLHEFFLDYKEVSISQINLQNKKEAWNLLYLKIKEIVHDVGLRKIGLKNVCKYYLIKLRLMQYVQRLKLKHNLYYLKEV